MTSPAPSTAPAIRGRRLRRFARAVALTIGVWIVAAYGVLPVVWRHYEGAPGLAGFSMVTRTSAGIPGDPINLAFIGPETAVVCAFHAAGWSAANPVTIASSIRIVGSVLLDRPDPDAPVSPLLFEGRPEDLAFEKADGQSADRRHHVRLWRAAPGDVDQPPIWVGAATFDRGVGLSRTTLQVTHHIAADIDAERDFVVDDLSKAGTIVALAEVSGVGPTLDGRNGGGDRYFTDGEIVVATLNGQCRAQTPSAPIVTPAPMVVRIRNAAWRALRRWM